MTWERSARDLWAIVGVAAALSPIVPLGGAMWCLPQFGLQPVPDAGTATDASDGGNACPDQSPTMCGATSRASAVVGARRTGMPASVVCRLQHTTVGDWRRLADRPAPVLISSERGVRHAAFSLS
jgi:hypothetical protein